MQLSDEDIVMIDDSLRHICKDLAEAVFSRPERACEPEPFKRWTGQTPSAFRQQSRQLQDVI